MSITDLLNNAPTEEPERQYYFIEEAKKIVALKEQEKGRKLTCCVTTFGCQMNARDSEKLLGVLKEIGYVETTDENADFVIYNTCTVRENANNKVYGHLGILHGYKKKNKDMMIGLCGCMMQEPTVIEHLQKNYKFVDLIFGTHNLYKFAELFTTALLNKKGMIIDIWKDTDKIVENLPISRKYPFKSGVNISFGCNNFCTYCIVPYVRGRERSRKPEDIVAEIKELVADGVVEIMLLGQNVNSYGVGLEEKVTFADLLRMVNDIEGLERIRFMTPHPKDLSDDLIEAMATLPKVCHHMHLPLQSGSTEILKKMNRRYTKEHYLELVEKLRARVPDVAITTDIIVGFPGETDLDFEATCNVAKECFNQIHVFPYSAREGTPAAKFPNQVSPQVKSSRVSVLMGISSELHNAFKEKMVGKTMKALIEKYDEENDINYGKLTNYVEIELKGLHSNQVGNEISVNIEKSMIESK